MKITSLYNGQNVAEITLSFKPTLRLDELPVVRSSQDAYAIFLDKWDSSKIEFVEEFKALFVNRASKVIGICSITSGGLSSTVMDYRILFAVALKALASGFIIAHNHPSGTLKPSNSDIEVTKSIREAGKLLNIELIDHLIVTRTGYYSFQEQGAL